MKNIINTDKTALGIELGSTRIKACLIGDELSVIASGAYEWENKLENGYWTYSLDEIHKGVKGCFKDLSANVKEKYGVSLKTVGALGISGMMHGYLAFDENMKLLTPFRTWRNTTTAEAAEKLTELFGFNIPERWSIAHLYQAMLNGEEHTKNIAHITTLAGYIHYLLTGNHELGIGEASGMFPVSGTYYDGTMLDKFDLIAKEMGYSWNIREILPNVKLAGEKGAFLTDSGAAFIDETGELTSGVPVCPPEGDAGTGMVATNSVNKKTGNVSAGTSIFATLVLEKPLVGVYPEIDVATTPDGSPVAMVHCNNCTAELDAWVKIFGEALSLFGVKADKSEIYEKLYINAAEGDADCGGICACNYLSGEHTTGIKKGSPMYSRTPESKMNLANFIRSELYSAMATLKLGMNILFEKEKVSADVILAHGGLFKVKGVAQQMLADALDTPVSVMETAGEGGAWGMALLAAFMKEDGGELGKWLTSRVFGKMKSSTLEPEKSGVDGFNKYSEHYKYLIAAEKALENYNA